MNTQETIDWLESISARTNGDLEKEVIKVFRTTKSNKVRHLAALAMMNYPREEALPALIEVIKRSSTKGYRGTLVYACSAFDCSKELKFFALTSIIDTDETSLSSLSVIREMSGGFIAKDVIYSLRRLQREIERTELSESRRILLIDIRSIIISKWKVNNPC